MKKVLLAGACLLFAVSGANAADPPSKDICRVFGQNSPYCQNELKRERAKEEAKKEAEEAKKPANILKDAYSNYIMVKTCYEVRNGYEYVWINDVQMREAKQYAAEIEKKLNIPNHDEIWASIDTQKIHDSMWETSQYTGVRAHDGFSHGSVSLSKGA